MSLSNNIVVLTGGSFCNVLDYAARQAARAWQAAGHEVLTVDFEQIAWNAQLQQALNADPRFVFTFDPGLLDYGLLPGRGLCELFAVPVIVHLPHHPARHLDALLPPHPRLIPVVSDFAHQLFLKRMLARHAAGIRPAASGFFPHPACPPCAPLEMPAADERPLAVLFAGTLEDPRKFRDRWHMRLPPTPAALMDQIAEHCARHDDVLLDQILEAGFRRINEDLCDDIDLLGFCYRNMEAYLLNFRRLVCLQTMIESGTPIQVHCSNPELLEVPYGFPAAVDAPVDFGDLQQLHARARVVLSINADMSGSLDARLASAMVNQALVVSDHRTWLRREFPSDRMAVYFHAPAPEKGVAALARVLRRERKRVSMAAAAGRRVAERYDMRRFVEYVGGLADAWHDAQSQ